MKITKTTVREYEICDCAKWRQTIGETLAFRESHGIKNRGLDKCFVCGYKFGNEEYPYLALIKNYKNQFICEKCAEKVNPDRVRSETGMMRKLYNLWLRYKTKDFTKIPLFTMVFDYQKFRENGKDKSCVLYAIHPDIVTDEFLKGKLQECVDYIRDNYDMERFTEI